MADDIHIQISTLSEPRQKPTMGNSLAPQNSNQLDRQSPHQHTIPLTTPTLKPNTKSKKVQLIPLIFLIYFEVSGGPFGAEPAVQAAGPFYALLGFLVFPFIWSIPEALITAELATAFPGNGGYVIWASHAFGPFFGSLMGSWKFISGVINNAAYPVLCADYLKLVFPAFSAGLDRYLAISFFTVILSILNYIGLTIVGYTAVCLGVISLLPFVIMTVISIKKIHPDRWINFGDTGVKKDWSLYLNTLFWNLNFWDNVSTLAGEVDRPQKTLPKALLSAGFLTCLGYFIPLLAATGALAVPQTKWDDGFFADAAAMIAGKWLKIWVEIGSVLSAIGLYEAQLGSCAYQLEGMADMGYVPLFFAKRSKWFDTPWIAILVTTALTLGISFMDFTDIISSANFFYSLSMLLEFSAFIWLRWKYPLLKRPYKVPMGMFGIGVMCLVPAGFVVFVMTVASKMVYVISAAFTVVGIVGYFSMNFCKAKGWFEFSKKENVWGEEREERIGEM